MSRVWEHFGDMLITLAPFLGHFGALGVIFGALGMHFSCPKRTGAPKVPQEAPEVAQQEIPSHIWTPFGDNFSYIFIFLCKSTCASTGSFFSSIFGSPWSLRGVGAYAIRTRLRSRNTLFCFCSFPKKLFPEGANGVTFGVDFGVCVEISVKKGASKKVPLPTQTSVYSRAGRLLGSPPRARALFKQETTI